MSLSVEEFKKIFEIFQVECDEHLQKLNSGLLALEMEPEQPGLIEGIFREAHNMKGAARMIGLTSIEEIGHGLETIFGKIKTKNITISNEMISLVLKALDTISIIIDKISKGGTEKEIEVFLLLKELTDIVEEDNGSGPGDQEDKISEPEQHDHEENFEFERDINLFVEETSEANQFLINSLLNIEKNHEDDKDIKNAYHQAHILKGSAYIVNHTWMGNIANAIERILAGIMHRQIFITPTLINTLLEGTDHLKVFIGEVASTGKIEIDDFGSEDYSDYKKILSGIQVFEEETQDKSETRDIKISKDPQYPILRPQTSLLKPQSPLTTPIIQSTVRVSSDKLDRLMDHASELLVMKLKVRERLNDIQSVIENCSNISREVKKLRRTKKQQRCQTNSCNTIIETSEWTLNRVSLISERLENLYKGFSDDQRQFTFLIDKLQNEVRNTRLLPFHTIIGNFPRMVRDLSLSEGKKVNLKISGDEIELDKYILEEIKDPLMHMLRNCVDHGIETPEERKKQNKPEEGRIHINLSYQGDNALIEVTDDGKGLEIERIKEVAVKQGLYVERELMELNEKQILNLIFYPGFTTSEIVTDISGRGIGMDVVKSNIEKLNGTIDFETVKDKGSKLVMIIPLTLRTISALKISVCDDIYYLPVNMVEKILKVNQRDLRAVEGRPVIQYESAFIPFVTLASILDMPDDKLQKKSEELPIVILRVVKSLVAFAIDKFLGEEDIFIKGTGGFMKRVRNVAGVTIMQNGEVAAVLNVSDLINSLQTTRFSPVVEKVEKPEEHNLNVMVVDDSIMTRTLEKNILESYGYNVITAVDGLDALSKLKAQKVDVIISDIQMPNMDGLELTGKIKQNDQYKDITVILVTALGSDKDKKRGIEIGADAYIVKSSFDQSNLVRTIQMLV